MELGTLKRIHSDYLLNITKRSVFYLSLNAFSIPTALMSAGVCWRLHQLLWVHPGHVFYLSEKIVMSTNDVNGEHLFFNFYIFLF